MPDFGRYHDLLRTALDGAAGDPTFPHLGDPDAAILLWDASATRLLWASPAAAPLARAFADEHGRVDGGLPALARLRALAGGLAARGRPRLERLRFDKSQLAAPSIWACSLVPLPSGEDGLVTVLTGPIPKLGGMPARRGGREADGAKPGSQDALGSAPAGNGLGMGSASTLAADRAPGGGRQTVRFLWQADPDGRFTAVGEELARVVGAAAADIIGRRWSDLAPGRVHDPSGAVARAIAARATFSGATVFWRAAGDVVPIDLAGMPIHGGDGFVGFRGFGLCRSEVAPRAGVPIEGPAEAVREEATAGDQASQPPEPAAAPGPRLSVAERMAFREIARALGARFSDEAAVEPAPAEAEGSAADPAPNAFADADVEASERLAALERELREKEGRLRELSSILDTATDGVIVLDEAGRILSLNRSAEALFGYDCSVIAGETFIVLLAPESHVAALDYLEGLRANGVASVLNDGREVVGRVRQGGTIPLSMTIGRVDGGPERKFCVVLRDMTVIRKTEGDLLGAKRAAEAANAQKSDFLAKISHEIRTPLSAIIGFAEVMLEERFGPIGNDRYKDYLSDIHGSGEHVVSLVQDLLDLAKIEAGRMELAFTSVDLTGIVASCAAMMQVEAARARIVMRTSFPPKLPSVVADPRSIRQIALNIVSNAIKFTDAGGQVIVSTALTDRGEAVLRVRDTGIGMTPEEVEAALEPFRQIATTRKGGGTGLGLPLTKALVEANRGMLHIMSEVGEGTLVEVVFPPNRVLVE